jgi:hypothetical protein
VVDGSGLLLGGSGLLLGGSGVVADGVGFADVVAFGAALAVSV